MKNALRIFLLFLACTLLACILYPGVYTLWVNSLGFMHEPVRIFRRVWMISLFAGLIVFRRQIGLQRPSQVGFSISKEGLWNFVIGFLVACVFLFTLSLLYLAMDAWVVRDVSSGYVMKRFINGFYQGILVALIEEYLFRGLIFLSLASRLGWLRAAMITSLIFSSLHFFEGRGLEEIQNPGSWDAGFRVCLLLLSNMAHEFTLFPDAVGLFCVGLILCYAVYRTGTLWYAAGLHGGWVFYTKFKAAFFTHEAISEFWVGGGRMFNGIIPMLAMFIIFPATHILIQRRWVKTQAPPVRENGGTSQNQDNLC